MFHQIRYQTGEIGEIAAEMKNGSIPCMDVQNREEYEWVLERLIERGIYRHAQTPEDRTARDRLREPDFEFRTAFCLKDSNSASMYLDVYFEPDYEETYDPVGEL